MPGDDQCFEKYSRLREGVGGKYHVWEANVYVGLIFLYRPLYRQGLCDGGTFEQNLEDMWESKMDIWEEACFSSKQMEQLSKGPPGRMGLVCSRNSTEASMAKSKRWRQRENGLSSRNSHLEQNKIKHAFQNTRRTLHFTANISNEPPSFAT